MKHDLEIFENSIREAKDSSYYQETFYFNVLIAMSKDVGGSRDETKNDIRALAEVLTVTLVEKEKGGIQRDLGTKYLSTLKVHIRKPKTVSKTIMMKRLVRAINAFRGVSVLRYKEKKPKPRKKVFRGRGSYKITEGNYYQSARHKKDLKRKFNRLTKGGPQTKGSAPFSQTNNPDWEQAPPGARGGGSGPQGALEENQPSLPETPPKVAKGCKQPDQLYEDILISIGAEHDDLMAFDIQPELNQKIWDGNESVRAGVKGALLDVVEEFLEGLDLDLDIKDIIMTGSLANYNWSKFSDIDLHILVDFAEVNNNKEMVKKFFDAVRSNWNKLHNILVKGHEVEIYVQDEHEPHISTGVYSLKNDRWLVVPKKIRPAIDRATATKKMKQIAREVDKLSLIYDNGQYADALGLAERLKEKIKRMRQAGLASTGLYSPENLAFKMLRRSGDIEQLFSIYTQAYDRTHSLDQ